MKQVYIIFIGALYATAHLRAYGACATGFDEFTAAAAGVVNAYTLTANSCRPGDTLVPIIDAYIQTNNIIRCAPTGTLDNGACAPFAQTNCATGFIDTNVAAASLSRAAGNVCGGILMLSSPDIYIIESIAPRCGPGYYPTPDGCAAYALGDGCPANYYSPSSALLRPNANGTCGANYRLYNDAELCKLWPGADSGKICTPQLLCDSGGVALRTSTGINLPIYRERVTTTTLNFGFENGGVCYMNMIPGAGANTINIKYNNETYHGVE